MSLEGGCFCGAARYRVEGDPAVVCHCHCLHCRRISGAAFVTWAEFRAGEFAFTAGKPAGFHSRPGVTRDFCAECGTPLTYRNAETPATVDVTVCSLDRPETIEPDDHLFCDRLLPWIHLDDGLPGHAGARPPEARRILESRLGGGREKTAASLLRKPGVGAISWTDLTVDDAVRLRDFYQAVVGWSSSGVEMKGYSDFSMKLPHGGATVAGICHARGVNAGLPAQWLVYITVEDLDRSVARCVELGGSVIAGPGEMGGAGRHCVIRDPAGAVAALFAPAP